MTTAGRRAAAGYLRFLAWSVALVALAFAAGYLPTRAWVDGLARRAMLAGCSIGLLASWLGAVPVAVAAARGSSGGQQVVFGAMALRLLIVLALVLPAAFSGWFARAPLLVWVAVSYAVLLAVDTQYALAALKKV